MSELDSEYTNQELEWERRVEEMKERLKNRLDENTMEGKRDDNLYHGMKLVSSTTTLGNFIEICYCEDTKEYLVIDSPSNMLRYSVEGKLIQPSYPLSAAMLFTKLLWCQKAKVLIGYIPNDDIIWLMTSFCMLYQIVRNEFRITSIFYEPTTNEAIVAGPNKVTRFQLANKESTMNSWKTISYIDSEYGALWKLECMSLVPAVNTSILRMAGSYMTTIYVISLETYKEKEDIVPIMFLARNQNATEAQITALLFQTASQWIITGDEQGNVMGWDLELNCVMNCPGSHVRNVRLIIQHPSICGFVTCGEDNVMQIWSCNLRGKMESFSDVGEIWGIAINESAAAIATLGHKLCCFNMHQLYTFYAALSDSATQIISTMNPMYPTRVIVRSSDNTIRILTSTTGKQINLQILPRTLNLVSMSYSGNRERLYTIILKTGEVLVSNTRMNPMELKHVWVSDETIITCITAYEYYEEIRGYDLQPQNPRVIYPKHTLIFVGTKEGFIISIDESSGKHEAKFSAHIGPITKLWSSTISKLVVSVGFDKCVKVWRVYADLAIPLALAYSVYYTVPITQIVTMGSVMCMVSSTSRSLVHQLFMYNMVETVRLDHHPSKDHTKLILDITASESLEICATSSMDNTIRLWDQQNVPIKVLEINTCANNIAFSSLRGDIVFGAGRHLYRISYRNYLAPKYRAKILVNEIEVEIEEDVIPENEEYIIYNDVIDREFLLHPVSSAPLGTLDISEGNAPRLELMIQQQMCAQLQRRDQDIRNIKNGEIKTVKLVADKSLMNHDAWEKYIEDISGATNKTTSEITGQDIWAIIEKYKDVKRFYNKPGIFKMLYGYSIDQFPEYPNSVPDAVAHPRLPLFGFIPNSVIYKLFSDEDLEKVLSTPSLKEKIKYEYPEEFTKLSESESSRFNSKDVISASQLLNFALAEDVESDATVIRAAISEDQSPFVRMARVNAEIRKNNSTKEKSKTRKTQFDGIKRKRISVAKRPIKRKDNKLRKEEIPTIIKKIIYADQGKLEMILSQKLGNGNIEDNSSWKENKFVNISRADIAGVKLNSDKDLSSLSSFREKLNTKKQKLCYKRKIRSSSKIETRLKKKRDPNLDSNRDTIINENFDQTIEQKFAMIDDLVRLKTKKIIEGKKSIEEMLRNNYGQVSTVYDDKIKETLMSLLAKCTNASSSFSSLINLLTILPVDDIEIVAFLCAIFTVTSKKLIRKSVIKYMKNNGLQDPENILSKQLIVVKNLTDTSDLWLTKKFVSGMINNWINTLKRHVVLVAQKIQNSDNLKSLKSFLQKEASSFPSNNPKSNPSNAETKDSDKSRSAIEVYKTDYDSNLSRIVVSPIEGINYFCELNARLFIKVENNDRSA